MKLRLTIALLITLLPIFSFAASKAAADFNVWGFVKDSEGNILSGADIYTSDKLYHAFSDENGRYSITVSRDTLKLIFSYVGFLSESELFVKKSGSKKSVRHDLALLPDDNELEGVTISGGALQTTTAEKLNISTINVTPSAAGGGIESIVKTFQGVSSNNELSSQYNVRGGSYDENSVYVNGIEVYRPYLVRTGEQEGLSFVNPDMAGSVTFSAGGFDAKYGDKLSSVLNVTYRKPKSFEAGVSGSLYGASGYIGSSGKKYSQIHGVRYKNNALLLKTMPTQAEYNPNFVDYQTYITYNPHEDVELSFLGYFSQNIYNFVPQSRNTTFGPLGDMHNFKVYFSGKEKDVYQTFMGAIGLKYSPDDNTDLNFIVTAFHTNEKVNYDIEGEYWLSNVVDKTDESKDITGTGNYYTHARNTMLSTVVKGDLKGSHKLHKDNMLSWGVGAVYEMANEHTGEWEMRDSSGCSIPYRDKEVNLYYSLVSENALNEVRAVAYIQDEHKWHFNKGGILSLAAGVRMNYWTFNKEFTASPRLTLAYFPDTKADLRFRVATGMYYQQPSFKEVKDTVSVDGNLQYYLNRNIKSQRSIQVVAGMDYYYSWLRRPFKLTVEAYYKNITNIISYTQENVSVRYSGKNDGKGYVAGFDVKLFGELVPGVDSWVSFSLMRAMQDIDNDGKGYIPMATDQLFNISLFFQDYIPKHPQYRVHLLLNFAQGFPIAPQRGFSYSSNLRAPTYRRVDIGFSRVCEKGKDTWMGKGFFKPFQKIVIALEVLNLFGFNNVNSYYWVSDIYGQQFAVPNYLTGRQFNFKLQMHF